MKTNLEERVRLLMLRAEAEFGSARAEELRPEIRKMAEELELLHSYTLGTDDEP